jgi:hypothetical protein
VCPGMGCTRGLGRSDRAPAQRPYSFLMDQRTAPRRLRSRGIRISGKLTEIDGYAQGWQVPQACERLLGQSCRPQSFGTIGIHPEAPDPVAPKIEDAHVLRIDRRTAALP